LASLPELPSGLETLVIEQCPALVLDSSADRTGFANLEELSVKECPAIEESWMDAVLEGAPALRKLDASGCPQFTRILAWPPDLVDIRLEDCTGLEALPDEWPRNLRRIGLRRAARISKLPNFHRKLDFIDLAFTESLRRLPEQRENPRTLYLYGSGWAARMAFSSGNGLISVLPWVARWSPSISNYGISAARKSTTTLIASS
jgi:hypothetical protein